MIDKREILDTASALGLSPQIVEKDYALGWVLAGISHHKELRESWVFKGGTCLKKCFFETYRFSEDLDFTLKDENHLSEEFLKGAFAEISDWVYQECGLELPVDYQSFEIITNPRGNPSCQGKVSYRGPISPQSDRQLPRVKLDLTADEKIVLPPERLPIYHPYSDAPEEGIEVLTYAYEEAFGEKVRALGERTRPRDLYDVINLFRNEGARPAAAVLLDVLRQKCEFKGIGVPDMALLTPHFDDLEGAWSSMLAHQLTALPPLEDFWQALPTFFSWLMGGAAPATPEPYRLAEGESILRARTLRLPVPQRAQSFIEIIRFAAANRLLVDLNYAPENGRRGVRRVEPYSLRRTSDGNVILHIEKPGVNEHRTYRVDRIMGAEVTDESFIPRHQIELSADAPLRIPPTERSGRMGLQTQPARALRSSSRRLRTQTSLGPTYVYECTACGKRFNHKKYGGSLNPHKQKNTGYPCYGRVGMLVETKY